MSKLDDRPLQLESKVSLSGCVCACVCVYLAVELSKYFFCGPINVGHVKCGQTSVDVGLHGLNWKDKQESCCYRY